MNIVTAMLLLLILVICATLIHAENPKTKEYDDVKKPYDIKRSDDATMTSLEVLVQQQAAVIQSLETRLTATDNRMGALESLVHSAAAEVSTLKTTLSSVSRAVGFTAQFGTDPAQVAQRGIFKFDHVVSSVGEGYDPLTGIFTAPVSGLYAFFVELMATNDRGALELAIHKGGVELAKLQANGANNDKGSVLVTTLLAVGDRVWAQHTHGSVYCRGGLWTVFSGFLVNAV